MRSRRLAAARGRRLGVPGPARSNLYSLREAGLGYAYGPYMPIYGVFVIWGAARSAAEYLEFRRNNRVFRFN